MAVYYDAKFQAKFLGVKSVEILPAGKPCDSLRVVKIDDQRIAVSFQDDILYVKNHAAVTMVNAGWRFDPRGIFSVLNHAVPTALITQELEKKVSYLDLSQLIKIATMMPRLNKGDIPDLYKPGKGMTQIDFDNNILLSLFMYLPGFIDLWDECVDKNMISCLDIDMEVAAPIREKPDPLFVCQEDFEFLILMAILSNDKLLTPENASSMSARYNAYYIQNHLAVSRNLPEVFVYFNQTKLAAFHGFVPDVVKPGLIEILKKRTYGAVCEYAHRLLEGSGMTMITYAESVLTGNIKLRGFMTTRVATEIVQFLSWVTEKKLKHGVNYLYLKYICPEELRSMTQDTYKHLFALIYQYGLNTSLKNYRSKILDTVKIDPNWLIPLAGYEDDCESLDPELKKKVMNILQIKKINPDPPAINEGTVAAFLDMMKKHVQT